MALKVLIVDDEAPARRKLIRYVTELPGFEVAGEAANGVEALQMVAKIQPDCVLCDIQMPQLNGIDFVRLLPKANAPSVVFCTAFEAYAIEAFEVCAVDYLLKPISQARFNVAMERIRQSSETLSHEELIRQMDLRLRPTKIPLHQQKSIHLMDPAQLLFFKTEHKMAIAFDLAGNRYWSPETLDAIEGRLPDFFFRIHRSAILNLEKTFHLEPIGDGRFQVHIEGHRLVIARGPAQKLKLMFGF